VRLRSARTTSRALPQPRRALLPPAPDTMKPACVRSLVAALAASHPWELPVIEVCEVRVLAPATLEPVDISTATV
jgi:hypothetical protein